LRAISLLYHDVVASGAEDVSGFPGAVPARYKLERSEFERHLTAIANATERGTVLVDDVLQEGRAQSFLLTFDDGGRSAVEIAKALALRQWRGHFFITSQRIDTPGFVSVDDIRWLHAAGHFIGSHSVTHPARMSNCTQDELMREWGDSVATLEEIVGTPVTAASVPGGYYSRAVAAAAADHEYYREGESPGDDALASCAQSASVAGLKNAKGYSLAGEGPDKSAGLTLILRRADDVLCIPMDTAPSLPDNPV